MIYLLSFVPLLVVTATVLLMPNLTPRYSLFGVRVLSAFRESVAGRSAIRKFRLTVLAGFFLAGLLAFYAPGSLFSILAPLLVSIASAMGAWFWQYRRTQPFAIQATDRIASVELSADADRVPFSVWLSIIPPLLLLFSALYLYAKWDRIPAQFPVHLGVHGEPNRWADRTARGVYGPLIFSALLDGWLATLMFSLWFGVRRSKYRKPIVHALVAVQLAITSIFCGIALSPVWKLGPGWEAAMALGSIVGLLIFLILYAFRINAMPDDTGDGTPESAWHGGAIYFNREDPAIAVPRRDGFGYTINLANYRAWLLTLAPFAIVAVAATWLL